ncbi:MAG: hypothetical protein GY722_21660 [bacterium]|nr:hypothetical protein [bacterium]
MTANKQFDETWGVISSCTRSNAYGRARDDLSYGSASAGYDISQQAYDVEVGLMPYDVPHAIKVAGSFNDEYAWELGTSTPGSWGRPTSDTCSTGRR